MKYEVKAVVIGRKQKVDEDKEGRPCFVSLNDENDPHRSGKVPREILDFNDVFRVMIKGLDIRYVLEGNDIVINDLKNIELIQNDGELIVTGEQE